uniref:Uncharacterized protein n=1 Tax=Morchella importuna TaxID=1174673 RepID=A0A650AF53_9PEZI|nr:hypothetical protein [Morchella importuna]QGN66653.1 hypothetical protein [Morchella importuna]
MNGEEARLLSLEQPSLFQRERFFAASFAAHKKWERVGAAPLSNSLLMAFGQERSCLRRSPSFLIYFPALLGNKRKGGARPWGPPSPFSFLFFLTKKLKKKTYKWALQQLGGALRRRPSFSTVLRE